MNNLLEVSRLKKYFKTPNGFLHAVDDVSFSIEQGKTLGVVGESGCGKSTLGRVILGLTDATSGSVLFDGEETVGASKKRRFQAPERYANDFSGSVFIARSTNVCQRID